MELEEKFKDVLYEFKDDFIGHKTADKRCVQIAGEFAVGFVEWITSNSFIQSSNNLWYAGSD